MVFFSFLLTLHKAVTALSSLTWGPDQYSLPVCPGLPFQFKTTYFSHCLKYVVGLSVLSCASWMDHLDVHCRFVFRPASGSVSFCFWWSLAACWITCFVKGYQHSLLLPSWFSHQTQWNCTSLMQMLPVMALPWAHGSWLISPHEAALLLRLHNTINLSVSLARHQCHK